MPDIHCHGRGLCAGFGAGALYAAVITAGTHKASSIKVAEAAKVIENTQRDLNIALMNELSMIFCCLGIGPGHWLPPGNHSRRSSRQ